MREMKVDHHGRRVRVILFTIGALLVAGGGMAGAQTATATLSGVVTDETREAVADATITVFATDTGFQREVTTDGKGRFTFAALEPGRYAVRARRPGFKPVDVPEVVLTANEQVALQLELKVEAFGESIVVTAQKRGEERLQDVPIPVTVLNGETLVSRNQLRLRDYFASVPGLSMVPNFINQQRLAIRGISNNTGGGASNPTVGVLVDDVPFGGSTATTSQTLFPDVDPGDLARIEVMRGPQGTMYGSNSMGGLVKFVTKDPTVDAVSGQVETGIVSVRNGGAGYNVRANINVPVDDRVGIRISGFTRHDPGYIDNPVRGLTDVNGAQVSGGRVSAMWWMRDRSSLKVSATFQHVDADGVAEVEVEPGLGDLEQNFLPGAGSSNSDLQAYSATLHTELAHLTLTSVTGYNRSRQFFVRDNTVNLTGAQLAYYRNTYGVSDSLTSYDYTGDRFTQELRMAGRIGQRTSWIGGGFYTDERADTLNTIFPANPTNGTQIGTFGRVFNTPEFTEYAVFGALTRDVTDRLDVQFGGRFSWDSVHVPANVTDGPYAPVSLGLPSPVVNERQFARTDVFTYLVTPRFRVTPNAMVYARLASGYRPGGANSPSQAAQFGVPAVFDPDKTLNYEVGVKASVWGNRLSIDASLFYIDWSAIQLGVRAVQGGVIAIYNTNGGRAKSEGAEMAATMRPWTGMTIAATGAYTNAVLTDPFPSGSALFASPGDALPITPKWTGSMTLTHAVPLPMRASGFVEGAVTYVGNRQGFFPANAAASRQRLPEYTKIDLLCGAELGSWAVSLFALNVADRRGLLNGGAGYNQPNVFVYIQPRSVGLSLSRRF